MKTRFIHFCPLALILVTLPIQNSYAQKPAEPPAKAREGKEDKGRQHATKQDQPIEPKKEKEGGRNEEAPSEPKQERREKNGKGRNREEAPPAQKMQPEVKRAEKKDDKSDPTEREVKPAVKGKKEESGKRERFKPETKTVPKANERDKREGSAPSAEKDRSQAGLKPEKAKEAREVDISVDRTNRQVEEKADKRKLNIKDKDQARDMIRDLIGAESEVSRAEAARAKRLDPRVREVDRKDRKSRNRDELRGASDFLARQLSGRAGNDKAPAFFRNRAQPDLRRQDRSDDRRSDRGRYDPAPPRYYHEGRRYVRYDSRNSIPAILLAAAVLERVSVLPASRTDTYFPENNSEQYANSLPPERYRRDESVVVSYPVSKSSMISSNDIIFAQGTTRFADQHSYDMVLALADAMGNPELGNARFIIEGHASAEGSYEENQALSQRRAEAIVRDMVREGIDPERLIPVGYGESEARYPADSAEDLRSQDRNVMVFRMDG